MVEIHYKFGLLIARIQLDGSIISKFRDVLYLFVISNFICYKLIEQIVSMYTMVSPACLLDVTWHRIYYFLAQSYSEFHFSI